jgi:hypothetical protein
LRDESAEPKYRARRVASKLDRFSAQLRQWLDDDAKLPRKQRRMGVRLCEALQALGYEGGYGRVVAFIRRWEREAGRGPTVFIPLKFAPGEAFQFDWSEEQVVLAGQPVTLRRRTFVCASAASFSSCAIPRRRTGCCSTRIGGRCPPGAE